MLRVIGFALRWWLGRIPAELRDGAAAAASVNRALEETPCGPCADYQRGATLNYQWGTATVHACVRIPEGWLVPSCPCGCDA